MSNVHTRLFLLPIFIFFIASFTYNCAHAFSFNGILWADTPYVVQQRLISHKVVHPLSAPSVNYIRIFPPFFGLGETRTDLIAIKRKGIKAPVTKYTYDGYRFSGTKVEVFFWTASNQLMAYKISFSAQTIHNVNAFQRSIHQKITKRYGPSVIMKFGKNHLDCWDAPGERLISYAGFGGPPALLYSNMAVIKKYCVKSTEN